VVQFDFNTASMQGQAYVPALRTGNHIGLPLLDMPFALG